MQAILFNKNHWTTNRAESWLGEHKYKPIKPVHVTTNYLRYRLQNPGQHQYRTVNLGNKVKGIKTMLGGSNILAIRPDHYARLLRPTRGGSLYGFITSHHDLVNGLVGAAHAIGSLAALAGFGYAVKRAVGSKRD